MVFEGLSVDIEDKLTQLTSFIVEIYCCFDAADFVNEGFREHRSGLAKWYQFGEVGLVEFDFDGLTLRKVLGNKRMLNTFDEEVEGV